MFVHIGGIPAPSGLPILCTEGGKREKACVGHKEDPGKLAHREDSHITTPEPMRMTVTGR